MKVKQFEQKAEEEFEHVNLDEMIAKEVREGHYYSDTCQFHDNYRQFNDLHLQFSSADELQFDQDPDFQQLRVFEILRRIEVSISIDLVDNFQSPLIAQGVFITDQLFIPRYIWFKPKISLPLINEKIGYYNEIRNNLIEVRILYNKGAAQIKHLQNLAKVFAELKQKIGLEIFQNPQFEASVSVI